MITFGPIPSRRLGRSLGINNIPPKICTYSCVYCQVVNDNEEHLKDVAAFLAQIEPVKAYISIPVRPPAEPWVQPSEGVAVNQACEIFNQRIGSVESLVRYEGNAFAFSGDVEEDLLGITAVHPMTAEAVQEFLQKAKASWSMIQGLISHGLLSEIECQGKRFYVRKLPDNRRRDCHSCT